jgi:hypothetical protein
MSRTISIFMIYGPGYCSICDKIKRTGHSNIGKILKIVAK